MRRKRVPTQRDESGKDGPVLTFYHRMCPMTKRGERSKAQQGTSDSGICTPKSVPSEASESDKWVDEVLQFPEDDCGSGIATPSCPSDDDQHQQQQQQEMYIHLSPAEDDSDDEEESDCAEARKLKSSIASGKQERASRLTMKRPRSGKCRTSTDVRAKQANAQPIDRLSTTESKQADRSSRQPIVQQAQSSKVAKKTRKKPLRFTLEEDMAIIQYFHKKKVYTEICEHLPERRYVSVRQRTEKLMKVWEKALEAEPR